MARPQIGDRPLTNAERVARHRAKKRLEELRARIAKHHCLDLADPDDALEIERLLETGDFDDEVTNNPPDEATIRDSTPTLADWERWRPKQ